MIESNFVVSNSQEDEGIEIDNTNFEENNENEIEVDYEGPSPPEYEEFDEDDRYGNVNNLSEEEKRKILEDVYGEDIFNVEREYNQNNMEDIIPQGYEEYETEDIIPREYGYEDIIPEYNYDNMDEDMTVEFVDETNQNEY